MADNADGGNPTNPANPTNPTNPTDPAKGADGKAGGSDDGKVVLSKEEHDNLIKARDSERERAKKAETDLAKYRTDDDDKKKKAEREALEKKGEYEKILAQKDEEIGTYKKAHERLTAFEEAAKVKNEEDLKLFTDADQKKLVEETIKGKDPLEAREVIKLFKKNFLAKDDKSKNFGGGNNGNPDDKEVKEGKVAKLKEEFDELIKKQKSGGLLNTAEKKRVIAIPKEIDAIQKETQPSGNQK